MQYVLLLGRILYSAIFFMAFMGHFSQKTIEYATDLGIPAASFLVPLWGLIALAGALSILLGYKAQWGAWLIVIFLVPLTCKMHKFWGLEDANAAMIQKAMFMKNLAMIGAALIIAYFGSGPLSLDKREKRSRR